MDFLKLLMHLLPDFSALTTDAPQGISTLFWLVIMTFFIVAVIAISRHFLRFKSRLRILKSLLNRQDKETLAANRREVLQNALQLENGEVGKIWREFDESLVISSDQKSLFNTLDADHFFNARTLAAGLTVDVKQVVVSDHCHAACFSGSASVTWGSRSGLSETVSMGVQLRVFPLQRDGLACRAARFSA